MSAMQLDSSIDNPILTKLSRRPLRNIRPRIKDRTETLWSGAVTIAVHDSLYRAFQELSSNNITSLPVVNAYNKVVGVFDFGHLLYWLTDSFDNNAAHVMVKDIEAAIDKMKTVRISSVWYDRYGMSYSTLRGSQSLLSAGDAMAKNHVQRIIVTDWQDRPMGIFTQSMLIGEVKNNLPILPKALKGKKVKELTKTYWVDSVLDSSTAIGAFRRLSQLGRHGIAVVNEEGAIVDELLLKDLKGLKTPESFLYLYRSVVEFKKMVRDTTKTTVPQVVKVDRETTFETVIRLMDETPAARVFVCTNDLKKPLYTLSQTDIINQFFPKSDWW